MSSANKYFDVTVQAVTEINELVKRFDFVRDDGEAFPAFSGGAHIVVEMHDGDITRRNPYSLMSDPRENAVYSISVRRDDQGRGGSLYMHQQVSPGMQMKISHPANLFGLDLRANKHLMIAGGIGITPFIAQMAQLSHLGINAELHYATRSPALASYADELQARYGENVSTYFDDQGQSIDLPQLLSGQPLGTHLYVCGPKPMIDWVRGAAAQAGWPADSVHHEEFAAPKGGKPFEVKLAVSNKTIVVGEHQSLLEAIEAAGVDAPYLCRGGACGQCETSVIDYDGRFIHEDHWLSEEERASGKKIMPCVSRFEGPVLVLDR